MSRSFTSLSWSVAGDSSRMRTRAARRRSRPGSGGGGAGRLASRTLPRTRLTHSVSSSRSTGFRKKSSAPSRRAMMAWSMSPEAVSMMIGTEGRWYFIRRRTSRPSIPGMTMSRRTRSTCSLLSRDRAAVPSCAVRGRMPRRCVTKSERIVRKNRSSSTTRAVSMPGSPPASRRPRPGGLPAREAPAASDAPPEIPWAHSYQTAPVASRNAREAARRRVGSCLENSRLALRAHRLRRAGSRSRRCGAGRSGWPIR
jgi:hypothetical protein